MNDLSYESDAFEQSTGNGSALDVINGGGGDDDNGFSVALLKFAAVVTFAIMIVGIIGNFLTVAALLKCPKVRNVAAAFIISLCLADLIFCALVLPFSALRFLQGTWTHGVVLCKLIPFIQYGNIGVSLLCIAMITINRYVMIAHHNSYGRIYKRHWIAVMIAFCWMFSYGMQLPTLLGAWGRFDFDPRLKTCSIMSDEHGHSSKTTLFITAFVIPCLIIIACYTKIFWVVHKSEQRLKRHANKQNSIPNNLRTMSAPPTTSATGAGVVGDQLPNARDRVSANVTMDNGSNNSSSSYSTDVKMTSHEVAVVKQQTTRIKDQREVRARHNEWRITKMVLAIFLSFVICYLPITIVKVADRNVEHPSLHIFSYIMLYLSACINPIIYVIMNKQYRKAYKTVIMCEPSRLLSPFGKANGTRSAEEKWKDIGLSNNHSRTLISQMSAGPPLVGNNSNSGLATRTLISDQQQSINSSNNSNNQNQTQQTQSVQSSPMIGLELMSPKSAVINSRSMMMALPPPPPSVMSAISLNKSGNQNINNYKLQSNPHLMLMKNSSNFGNNIYRDQNGNGLAGVAPISVVGDDIILEEEDITSSTETVQPVVIPPPTTTTTAQPDLTITTATYMNINAPRKTQFYGPNIKDTTQANEIYCNNGSSNDVINSDVTASGSSGGVNNKVSTTNLKI